MSQIIEWKTCNGHKLLLEASDQSIVPAKDDGNPLLPVGRNDLADAAADTFEGAIEGIKPTISSIFEAMKEVRADSVTVEFGLTVSVGAFVFIKAGGEANFKVSVSLKPGS